MLKKVGYFGVDRFHPVQDKPSSVLLYTAFQNRCDFFYRLLSDY